MNIELEKAYILIDKFHRGQASEEEILALNSWKYSSFQNETDFDEMICLLELVNSLKDWKSFDKQKAWINFQKHIGLQKLSFTWQKMASIAAIFIFVLAATFWKFGLSSATESSATVLGADQKYTVSKDGSEFVLGADAILNLEQFGVSNRTLLTQGDYFVHVKSDLKSPFLVKTNYFEIKVLGTSFEVEEEQKESIVRVREGKVEITTNDGVSYTLTGQEEFRYSDGDASVSKLKNYDWGLFVNEYNDESIFRLLNDLADKFPYFKFSLESISPECRITTKIEQSTVIEILEEISLIFDVSYNIKNGQIVLNKISC